VVQLVLLGQAPITMKTVRIRPDGLGGDAVSLRVAADDWAAYRACRCGFSVPRPV